MLSSNFSNFWQFCNFVAFQWAAFQHFTSQAWAGMEGAHALSEVSGKPTGNVFESNKCGAKQFEFQPPIYFSKFDF